MGAPFPRTASRWFCSVDSYRYSGILSTFVFENIQLATKNISRYNKIGNFFMVFEATEMYCYNWFFLFNLNKAIPLKTFEK